MSNNFEIFDAHLDMAMNAVSGRDITQPAAEQPPLGDEIATVGLPDLRRGKVTHVCGTIFCLPDSPKEPGYRNAEEAHAMALEQIAVYERLSSNGLMNIVGVPSASALIQNLILLEGADAVRSPEDLGFFKSRGVGVIGLAWKATRYAGGTGQPGPLTEAGIELVRAIDHVGLIHDTSHLAEQSFWDLLHQSDQFVVASHSNCRAIVGHDPNERHLSDDMIRALVERGGVIGINFFDKFLLPHDQYGKRRASLMDVLAHIRHICDIAGDTAHVGIGTDMDGGLGRQQIPMEIENSGDLPHLAGVLLRSGFDNADVRAILSGNWRRALGV